MNSIKLFFSKIRKLVGIYLCYIICHYFASHLYTEYCVPNTFIGFIQSPFVAVLPHCQMLRWVIYNGGNTISMMWTILGGWMLLKLGNYLTEAEKDTAKELEEEIVEESINVVEVEVE
jgi:hypothetical protein